MGFQIDSFRNATALEEVEHIPVIPMVSGWVGKFSGIPLKTLIYDEEAIVRTQLDGQRTVGYDVLFAYIDPLYIPEAFGCTISFMSTGGAEVIPLDLQTDTDIASLPFPDIQCDGRLPLMVNVARKLVHHPGREVPVLSLFEGPFTNCARIMGTETMMRALMKKRPVVEHLLEKVTELLCRYAQALEQAGLDGLMIADPVGSATMVSPKIYRELVLPCLQRVIGGLKIPVVLHVCGNSTPILDLMAETGARILSLDQCMDLSAARQRVAGRCGIGGNVNPTDVLLLGTEDDVRRDTLRCLQQGGRKGYILMSGCAVPPRTPIENLMAMIEVARADS
jgi:MtaA/CmuA family methyltransferase